MNQSLNNLGFTFTKKRVYDGNDVNAYALMTALIIGKSGKSNQYVLRERDK
jgi:hypothetical protein